MEYHGDAYDNQNVDPEEVGLHTFESDGDFRSDECFELLKEADIVVTNPPFSLFPNTFSSWWSMRKNF